MNKEFERCCKFLAEMMEKYANVVMQDIIRCTKFYPEVSKNEAEGKKKRYEAYVKRLKNLRSKRRRHRCLASCESGMRYIEMKVGMG